MKTIRFSYLIVPILTAMLLSACSSSHDGSLKLKSTSIPLPLGRYVQFASDEVPFDISKPDSKGNVMMTLFFDFTVIRHIDGIGGCNLDGDINSFAGGWLDDLKFKKDQDAVKSLCNAIAGSNNCTLIQWSRVKSYDPESQAAQYRDDFLKDARTIDLESSTIYVDIKENNVRSIGLPVSFSNLRFAFYSDENDNILLYLDGDVMAEEANEYGAEGAVKIIINGLRPITMPAKITNTSTNTILKTQDVISAEEIDDIICGRYEIIFDVDNPEDNYTPNLGSMALIDIFSQDTETAL